MREGIMPDSPAKKRKPGSGDSTARPRAPRKTTFAEAVRKAQQARATILVYEENGRKIEMRFVEPEASTTGNPWDRLYDANKKRTS
jgi:hypothetical protein